MLTVQRDHYLPLKVIREHLEQMDRGQTPPGRAGSVGPAPSRGPGADGAGARPMRRTAAGGAAAPASRCG